MRFSRFHVVIAILVACCSCVTGSLAAPFADKDALISSPYEHGRRLLETPSWTQVDGDIDGEAGDKSGGSVSMSSDGTRVGIGGHQNGGGGAGSNAGHVRVYADVSPCDASGAITNGALNDCTSSLASGASCTPTCDSGYTLSGSRSCSSGTLTDTAACTATPCDASAAPTNGALNDCTSSLASDTSCSPTCNSGYTLSGSRSCSTGSLTDTAVCSANPNPSPPPPEAHEIVPARVRPRRLL